MEANFTDETIFIAVVQCKLLHTFEVEEESLSASGRGASNSEDMKGLASVRSLWKS